MSTITTRPSLAGPVNEWAGSAEALRVLATEQGVEPWSGSPLLGVEPARIRPAAPANPGFRAALLRVAQPEVRLDVSYVPPLNAAEVCFCGRSDSDWYAGHWVEGNMHHLAWPVAPDWLTNLLLGTVDAQREGAAVDLRFVCDRPGFEALVALVDVLQQESLVSLLEGRPARSLLLDGQDLRAAFLRPRADHDLRWMTARARRIAPVALAPATASLNGALAALEHARCTRRSGAGWQVEGGLRTACALLASVSGWFVVSRRVRRRTADGGLAWAREHAAVLRALDSLWIFHFTRLTASDFRVEIGDAASAQVRELAARLLAPLVPLEPSEPDVVHTAAQRQSRTGGESRLPPFATAPPPPASICATCGVRVRPGVTFCTNCGARL